MRRLALVAAVCAVLLTGCKLTISVGVNVDADGSGEVRAVVTLDKEAADRLQRSGGRLEAADLEKAGWNVTRADRQITATKRFNTPAELTSIIDEVAGERRPLRDFKLTRDRSFARTEMKFSGVVDLSGGVASFGDDRLKEQTGADLGVDIEELERQAGEALNRFFSVQVAVRLPGSVDANAPTEAANGAVWSPDLGERAALTASSSQLDTTRVVALGVSLAAATALIILLIQRRRRRSA